RRKGNKGLRAGNLRSSQQGLSSGSWSQARQKSPDQVHKYKPQLREITYLIFGHCKKHHRREFLAASDVCIYCSQPGQKHRDCASAKRNSQRGRVPTSPPVVLSSPCREARHMCRECPLANQGKWQTTSDVVP
ncbi:hypothetical protein HAX54_049233, partial [Datura stramonium]|nr:hypothetical protein [Datura stramonium]